MGANVAMTVLGLITGSIIARMLGPSGRGELAAIQNWPALLITLGALGIPQAVTYFCGRSQSTAGRTFGTGMLLLLALSLPLMWLGYVLVPLLLSAQSSATVFAARLYLSMIPLQFLLGLPMYALQGRSEIRIWNTLRFIPIVGWLVVVVLAALTNHTTPLYLAMGNVVITALAIVPVWLVLRRRLPGPYKPHRTQVRPLVRYGLPAAFANVPLVLNLRVDQLLMAAWLAPEVLGFYAIAVTWSSGVAILLAAVANVTFPRMAAVSEVSEQSQLLARIARTSTWLSLCLVAVFLVCTPVAILLLFGNSYLPAVPAAFILVVAAGIAGINQVMEDGLRGAGHPEQVLIAEVAGFVATIILLAILLRSYELMGAAIASLASYLLVLVSLLVSARRILQLSARELLVPRRLEIVAVWRQLLALAGIGVAHE